MIRLEFTVEGKPVAQGSARAFVIKAKDGGKPRAGITNDEDGELAKWRSDVRSAARPRLPAGFELIDGPVRLGATFRFARPKSHYLPANSRRPEPVLRPNAPTWHTQAPDGDKLLRAVQDALTGVVYSDDKVVAWIGPVRKLWARASGAEIAVVEIVE